MPRKLKTSTTASEAGPTTEMDNGTVPESQINDDASLPAKPKKINYWREACREYSKSRPSYVIPRKGTKEHEEVVALANQMRTKVSE